MSNAIVLENQLPGTPRSVWDVSDWGNTNIEGFATDISVDHGDTVDFKINTNSTDYRIEIYRLGYYGGDGARLVSTIQHSGAGVSQPAPLTDPSTGLVDAGNWSVTDSWNVPADAVSGFYLAKLVRQDGTFGEKLVPFIVRDDDGQSDIVLQTDDSTWHAYNTWGGASLYGDNNGTAVASAVSYNRPLNTEFLMIGLDRILPAIMWLEKNGYDVSYITNVDTARNGASLLDHQVFLSVGHDEYWSAEQYDNVMAARDAGVNLQFWAGNDIYWKTQWKPSIDGSGTDFRTVVTYKETERGTVNPDGVWTGTWSDPNATEELVLPNALKGNIFGVLRTDPYLSNITIPYEQSQLRFWRDTSIADTQPGETATLLSTYLGAEWNWDLDNGFRPAGLINVSSTYVATADQLTDFASVLGQPGYSTHNLTLFRAESGALVFSAGSQLWSWALDANHYPLATQNPPPDPDVQQAMVNLFADMGVQPVTLQADLVYATASSDFEAPTIGLTGFSLIATGADMTVVLTGLSEDLEGQVAGIEVSTDGGATWHPGGGTSEWSYTSTGAAPTTLWARAVDDSLNIGEADSVPVHVLTKAVADGLTGGAAQAFATLDEAGDQPWTIVWNNYDGFGNWDQQSITFDDGAATIAQLDPLNGETWSLVWNTYDAAGNWISQHIEFDNGTNAVASLDPLNSQSWSLVWDNYDAAGNWQHQNITFDDGTEAVASLDPLGSQQWSLVWDNYDDSGNWVSQNIEFDDGTSAIASLDPLNSQSWSLVWDNYSTAGEWISQSIQYDDGSTGHSDIDWANANDWFSDNYIYDSSNTLTSHFQVMDDGSTVYLFS